MQLTETYYADQFPIEAYECGRLKMNGQFFEHSVIINTGQMPKQWHVQNTQELTRADLQLLLQDQPEVILLGTGAQLIFPAFELIHDISHQGVGIEVMDTGAACRTYNLLLAEGRKVLAGLIL
ncbi:MAG: hypothetical protein HKM04_08615 [Legionellales bacterium]|nr:hypothetical protein [Legionellales bacterium]